MKRILLPILLLFSSFGFGQEPIIEWEKSLGGSGNDWAKSIKRTSDGGYIITGSTTSDDGDVTLNHGSADYWVVKLDVSGNIIWQKSFGGSENDLARSIQQTTDGGYIIVGHSDSNDGSVISNQGQQDFWVLKLDAAGNISWQKSLGGSGGDLAESIQQTADGGYIVAGMTLSNDGDISGNNGSGDAWVIKLDATGNITWQKSFGGTNFESAKSIQQSTDGGYIFTGNSSSNDGDITQNNGGVDCWVVKLDTVGNISWQKSLGGTEDDKGWSIQQTSDNGYILAGWSQSNDGDVTGNHGGIDFWVVKLDATGNKTWQKSMGGTADDRAYSVVETSDGGYIIAGVAASYDGDITGSIGDRDFWIVKIDQAGSLTWEKSLGGTGYDRPWSIQQTPDNGYVITGQSTSTDGDISNNIGSTDIWIVKLSPETSALNKNKTLMFNLYPNPTTKIFTISSNKEINSTFKVFDSQGQEALNGNMNGQVHAIDISGLTKGVYSVVFDDSELPVLSVLKK